MWTTKGLLGAAAALVAVHLECAAFENVNMNTRLSVQNNQLVVHWSTKGFHHYNIRWSEDGGPAKQVERAGDKDFRYLSAFRPGVVYRVAVQGCEKGTLSSSRCTSWDEVSCGELRRPCTGPLPMPIVNGGSLCLDVHVPDQRVNGARVQVWKCNGADQQLWTLKSGRVVSLADKCLDVHAPDMRTNGGRVQVWDCNGSKQQHWTLRDGQLRNAAGKCLDANASSYRQNGSAVRVWDCNRAIQQRWAQSSTY